MSQCAGQPGPRSLDRWSGLMFGPGDIVRHVLNDDVTGVVINELDFGSRYEVRLADMSTILFIVEELELVEPAGGYDESNVINFDEAVESLRRAAKEAGHVSL